MEKQTKILLGLAAAGVVAFALWRNFGVKAKNGIILDSPFGDTTTDTSNEQKELIQDIQSKYKIGGRPSDGDTLDTSFGKYKFVLTKAGNGMWIVDEGYWTKYAEVWQGFADDKDHPICPQGWKYVKFPLIKGLAEHPTDKNGGKCVENSLYDIFTPNITAPKPI